MTEASGRRRQIVGTVQAIALTVTGALPAFLTSAMAVQVQAELSIGPAGLGLATAILFAVSGICARWTGGLVQRRGYRFGYVASAGLSAISLTVVAGAPSYAVLVAGLAVGGLGNSIAQPTANLLLTQVVGSRRLGLAMGIKQSYIPAASIVGGLAVPTVALVFGWRWALVGGALTCALITLSGWLGVRSGSGRSSAAGRSSRTIPKRGLLVLTIGSGLAAASATAMGVFLVDSSVVAGLPPASAGYLLAACSAASLAGRIGLGWMADRTRHRSLYVLCANLMMLTAGGFVVLAFAGPTAFVVGALVAYVGWSWTGIFHLAIVRDSQGTVATSTGVVQTGLALGAAVGPLSFGLLAEGLAYQAAWLAAAVVGLAAVVVVRRGRRILRRSWGLPVTSYPRSKDRSADVA